MVKWKLPFITYDTQQFNTSCKGMDMTILVPFPFDCQIQVEKQALTSPGGQRKRISFFLMNHHQCSLGVSCGLHAFITENLPHEISFYRDQPCMLWSFLPQLSTLDCYGSISDSQPTDCYLCININSDWLPNVVN